MANRLFKSEAKADVIISEKTKNKSATVAEICNNGLYLGYLPQFSTELNTEADYILQNENISQEEIRLSLSRGVNWLRNYFIKNSNVLRYIMSHYSGSVYDRYAEDDRADSVVRLMRDAYYRLKDLCPNGNVYETINPSALAHQILDYWDEVYQDSLMYQMIGCAIHVDKNVRAFSRGEAIDILKAIEDEVIKEYIARDMIEQEKNNVNKCMEKISWLVDDTKHKLQVKRINMVDWAVHVELSDEGKNFKIGSYNSLYDLLDKIYDNVRRRDI